MQENCSPRINILSHCLCILGLRELESQLSDARNQFENQDLDVAAAKFTGGDDEVDELNATTGSRVRFQTDIGREDLRSSVRVSSEVSEFNETGQNAILLQLLRCRISMENESEMRYTGFPFMI